MGLCFAYLKLCTWSIKKKKKLCTWVEEGQNRNSPFVFFCFCFFVMKSCIFCGIDIELYVGLVFVVLGFFMQFKDDSLEFAKTVKQWNVKIISVSIVFLDLVGCFDLSYVEWDMSISQKFDFC